MDILRNIVHMLGGLILVGFFLFSGDVPGIILAYRWPIIGIYLLILAAIEFSTRRNSR